MPSVSPALCATLVVLCSHWSHAVKLNDDLYVGAFNVQLFGRTAMSKEHIVENLLKIIPQYDILIIQEIRDSSGESIVELLSQLNALTDDAYNLTISERLGRSNSKEQYGFLYRGARVTVEDSYTYDDTLPCPGGVCPDPPDKFERQPHNVLFSTDVIDGMSRFVMSVIHTKPTDAVAELDYMYDVYEDILQKWDVPDIILLGDFNAACSYVSGSDWDDIRLWTMRDPAGPFEWLIGTSTDTTVGNSVCAYDRIVVAGDLLRSEVIPNSAQVFYFDEEYGLNETIAEDVSDHYPVGVKLRGKVDKAIKDNLDIELSFNVNDTRPVSSHWYIRKIYYKDTDEERGGFGVKRTFTSRGSSFEVYAFKTVTSRDDIGISLDKFNEHIPNVLSEELIEVIKYKISRGALQQAYTHPASDFRPDTSSYDINIHCRLRDPLTCDVTVSTPAGLE